MIKVSARKILNYSIPELWDLLTGEFILVCDDGEITTDWKETIFSAYVWEIHKRYPGTPINKNQHVHSTLKGKRYSSSTHLKLIGSVLWSVYDGYCAMYSMNEDQKLKFRYDLALLAYQITCKIYGDLSYRCEEYAFSLDITDFIQIMEHPNIVDGYKNLYDIDRIVKKGEDGGKSKLMFEKAGEFINSQIKQTLHSTPDLFKNPLSELSRSGLVKEGQILRCVGPRMFVTDINSVQFKKPILRGYVQGFHQFEDSLMESRSASKALIFSKTPLQDAEYFSRKLQFMTMQVENLHHGDCGSGRYLRWTVRGKERDPSGAEYSGDLSRIAGKMYLNEKNELQYIKASDHHLIGQTINLRSVEFCQHPDPVGVCSTCFGQLSESIPANTNLGHVTSTHMCQKTSQSVLSVKHLDGSASIELIVLSVEERKYLDIGVDGNSYLLASDLRDSVVKILIPKDSAPNISDVLEVSDVQKLKPSNITLMSEINLMITKNKQQYVATLPVGSSYRKASLTHKALHHIKKLAASGSWPIDEHGNYMFDMQNWDWTCPFLELPLKHFNMSDHSKDIADILESRVSQMVARDRHVQPEAVLRSLVDLVNSRLHVNLAVLEVVMYGVMIRSAEKFDYALPKPWTETGLGVRAKTMFYRSFGVSMAYQGHSELIMNPDSYIVDNRMDHVFDAILCPREVIESGARK